MNRWKIIRRLLKGNDIRDRYPHLDVRVFNFIANVDLNRSTMTDDEFRHRLNLLIKNGENIHFDDDFILKFLCDKKIKFAYIFTKEYGGDLSSNDFYPLKVLFNYHDFRELIFPIIINNEKYLRFIKSRPLSGVHSLAQTQIDFYEKILKTMNNIINLNVTRFRVLQRSSHALPNNRLGKKYLYYSIITEVPALWEVYRDEFKLKIDTKFTELFSREIQWDDFFRNLSK